jgi:signal transduction histidine kinase
VTDAVLMGNSANAAELNVVSIDPSSSVAADVAHDFNNVLAVIVNYAGFIRDTFDDSDERMGDVDEIIDAAERGTALVRQLQTHSREVPGYQ